MARCSTSAGSKPHHNQSFVSIRDFIQLANYMYRGYFGKRPVMTVKGVKETRICYTSKFIVELNMLSSLIGRRHYRGEIDQKPVIDGWTSTQETLT